MKQIWPNYSYSPTTNVLTLTGLNIDRDQLLLVSAPERGRIMYNFADSTVTASAFTAGANTGLTLVASTAGLTTTAALVIYYDDQLQSTAITVSSLPAITGTVTANVTTLAFTTQGGIASSNSGSIPTYGIQLGYNNSDGAFNLVDVTNGYPIRGSVAVKGLDTLENQTQIGVTTSGSVLALLSSALPAGTNRIGVVTIGAGTVTIGAGTAQIGSVTASISGTVPISISSVTVGNSVTIGSLPAISGTVTAVLSGTSYVEIAGGIQNYVFDYTSFPISGTVTANTFAVQGTAVTTSNFTSTTASTVLANYNATRRVLTIFNEGAGNLHIAPGATCTTVQYQVRLSSGDYYEVPSHQSTITHSAVFATAGTARVTEVS
jgi:hypothetical protein